MNDTYTGYDASKGNVAQTLEFLASEHERIVFNLRVLIAHRDELLAEKDAENVALQAWKDAVPVGAIRAICEEYDESWNTVLNVNEVEEWLNAQVPA